MRFETNENIESMLIIRYTVYGIPNTRYCNIFELVGSDKKDIFKLCIDLSNFMFQYVTRKQLCMINSISWRRVRNLRCESISKSFYYYYIFCFCFFLLTKTVWKHFHHMCVKSSWARILEYISVKYQNRVLPTAI